MTGKLACCVQRCTVCQGLDTVLCCSAGETCSDKVALLIGNQTYKYADVHGVLYHPMNDVCDLAGVLTSIGFKVNQAFHGSSSLSSSPSSSSSSSSSWPQQSITPDAPAVAVAHTRFQLKRASSSRIDGRPSPLCSSNGAHSTFMQPTENYLKQ